MDDAKSLETRELIEALHGRIGVMLFDAVFGRTTKEKPRGKLISQAEVLRRIPSTVDTGNPNSKVHLRTFQRRIRENQFPPPAMENGTRKFWYEQDIQDWIDGKWQA